MGHPCGVPTPELQPAPEGSCRSLTGRSWRSSRPSTSPAAPLGRRPRRLRSEDGGPLCRAPRPGRDPHGHVRRPMSSIHTAPRSRSSSSARTGASAPTSSTRGWPSWADRRGAYGLRPHHPPGGPTGQGGLSGRSAAHLRPWITEPGMWLQFDWGQGPVIEGARRCSSAPGSPGAASGWSSRPRTGRWARSSRAWTRRCARSAELPTYALTDNEADQSPPSASPASRSPSGGRRRRPPLRRRGRRLRAVRPGVQGRSGVHRQARQGRPRADRGQPASTRMSASPSSPPPAWRSAATVNGRVHRETGARPDERLGHRARAPACAARRALHGGPRRDPDRPRRPDRPPRLGALLGAPRVRRGGGLGPRRGRRGGHRGPHGGGLAEIARHARSTPGRPQIDAAHYPDHPAGRGSRAPRPRPLESRGGGVPGPRSRGQSAGCSMPPRRAACGSARRWPARSRLAALLGTGRVDAALAEAALAGRFAEG